MMLQAAVLVSGVPGAGKTKAARALAARFERGVHLESDRLQEWIVSGGLWPNEEPREEAERQLRLHTRNVCMLADSFFEAGFTPVIDDVVIGRRLDDFLHDLVSRPVYFVLLTPSLEVVKARDASRTEKHVFEIWGHLDESMRRDTPRQGLWLDTSALNPAETVDAIVARLDEAEIA